MKKTTVEELEYLLRNLITKIEGPREFYDTVAKAYRIANVMPDRSRIQTINADIERLLTEEAKKEWRRERPKPQLIWASRWNDLLPTPGLRKQTAKMLADQQAHINELCEQGRYKAAKWQVACTYCLWVWYIAARPLTTLAKMVTGKLGGA